MSSVTFYKTNFTNATASECQNLAGGWSELKIATKEVQEVADEVKQQLFCFLIELRFYFNNSFTEIIKLQQVSNQLEIKFVKLVSEFI